MRIGQTGFWIGALLILLGCVVARLMGADWISIALIAPFAFAAVAVSVLISDHPMSAPAMIAEDAPRPEPTLADLLHHPDFDAVLCGLPMPALIVTDARVMAANPAALDLLGQHILGVDVRTAIRHPAAADRLANPATGSRGSVTELVGLGRGNQRWEMRTVPLQTQPSGLARLVLLQDQSAMEAAERMRSDFVANASHELRTPLAAILGFVETLQDDSAMDDIVTRHRFLSVIHAESLRMQTLVDDLISLSRIEAGKFQSPETCIDIAAHVRKVVAEVRNADPARGADIEIQAPDAQIMCLADPAQISQMFHNLITNAMKYGRAHTPIIVEITDVGQDMARIRIIDQGDGISEDHVPRLTERFYRVDSARSRAMGGTGLGLSIVKHIVERHRGRIDISSVVGEGTSISISLPKSTRASQISGQISGHMSGLS